MIEPRPIHSRPTGRSRVRPAASRLTAMGFSLLLLTAIANAGAAAIAQELVQSEARLKSAFIFNFAKFVEWPADAFAEPNSPLVVCIVGQDPLRPNSIS